MAESSDLSEIRLSFCEKLDDVPIDGDAMKLTMSEIIHILQLDDDENKDQTINNLLENGRQSLVKYKENIIFEIYTAEMDGYNGELILLLKKYFQQQWETLDNSSNKWFISFLEQYRNGENQDLYERVLVRTAEYGKKYMRDCPKLSIILQLLFEGIDDKCLNETNIFNDLWLTITNDGLTSITKYSDYIIEDTMNEQLNKSQSILFLALREYYRQPLFSLLKKVGISNKQNLYELALDSVAEHGWLRGVEAIQKRIVPKLYKTLLESVHTSERQQTIQEIAQSESTSVKSTTISNKEQGNHNFYVESRKNLSN
ncbi:unnamed protein product [Adineta steineri]|uniref:Uncharacterized protein n=1 Tax=Adineta steineri TaxID=433720 RepID=A0A818HI68_9BILA|nr:unnamed protein product [Adineta steineri]CAF3504733.1 unnamed protein product [Adineta steineri]